MKLKSSHEKKQSLYKQIENGSIPINEALKALRRSVGKTQSEYARIVRVTLRTIQEFEQGVGNPTFTTLNKIFKPFGLELYIRISRKKKVE